MIWWKLIKRDKASKKPKGRKTERQKGRKTERQKGKKAYRQTDKNSEKKQAKILARQKRYGGSQ